MADFFGRAAQYKQDEEAAVFARVARRKRRAEWILFAVLLYCVAVDGLYYLFPLSPLTYYLRPFSVMNSLSAVYPATHYWLCLFSVLPMVGWCLLHRKKKAGSALILVPYVLAWIGIGTFTFLHVVYALRAHSFPLVHANLRDAAPFLPFGLGVPILVHLWQK